MTKEEYRLKLQKDYDVLKKTFRQIGCGAAVPSEVREKIREVWNEMKALDVTTEKLLKK